MTNHFVDHLLSRGADDAPFLIAPDGETLDYAGLRRRVRQAADALARLGVAPGDRVAAQIEKSQAGFILYLGVVAAGAVFLPLNIAYTAAEVAYFLGDAEPALLVCDPSRAAGLATGAAVRTLDAAGQGTMRDAMDAGDPVFRPADRDASDLAAILYTSGTTGRSKGAMLTHGNLMSNALTLVALWRFTPDDRLLHALPTYHTHGLFTAATTAMAAGAGVIFLPRFDVSELIRLMPEATVLMGVPTFYTRLLDQPAFTRELAAHMRLFISGSAPLLDATHRRFAERCGHAILERYGMTETNMTTSNPYDGARRAGTVGLPLAGVAIRVVDEASGAPVAVGTVGMIEVKGPNVFAGYWRNPEKTAAEFRADGWFVTGDLGTLDPDGYLRISGRDKDLIIAGGLNIYPKEVELAIDAVPGVGESAVIGVPHPDLGEGVTAVVVAKPGATLGEADVVAALDGGLARFKQPKRVVFVPELPRNAMGKVQKKMLRDMFSHLYGAA